MDHRNNEVCSLCQNPLTAFGSKVAKDGVICRDCAKKASPFLTDEDIKRRSIARMKNHLEYRERNLKKLANFRPSKEVDGKYRLCVEEKRNRFLFSKRNNWEAENPDIFYFRQMFGQISSSIIESAKIDGASHTRILWSIVAPMSFSSFVTLGVFSFIGGYNAYVWPSLILKTKSKFLVSQGLQLFFVAEGAYGLKWGAIMSACTMIVVPLFILFAFCEKYIVAGISNDSAVKE